MSKIAKHLVKAIFEWCDDPTSPSGFDAAEAAIDKALEGKIIKKSELDGLRREYIEETLIANRWCNRALKAEKELASRVHTVIPVSQHETIKLLKAQKKELADVWAAKYDELAAYAEECDNLRWVAETTAYRLKQEIARRIDLDIARSACVDIEPPACLGPLDTITWQVQTISNQMGLKIEPEDNIQCWGSPTTEPVGLQKQS